MMFTHAAGGATALRYAAGAGLPVSVRSGGHDPANMFRRDHNIRPAGVSAPPAVSPAGA